MQRAPLHLRWSRRCSQPGSSPALPGACDRLNLCEVSGPEFGVGELCAWSSPRTDGCGAALGDPAPWPQPSRAATSLPVRSGLGRRGPSRRRVSQGGGGRQSVDGTRVTTPRNTQVKSLLLERAPGESPISSLWKPEGSWTPQSHLRQDEEAASSTSPPACPELVPYRPHPLYLQPHVRKGCHAHFPDEDSELSSQVRQLASGRGWPGTPISEPSSRSCNG